METEENIVEQSIAVYKCKSNLSSENFGNVTEQNVDEACVDRHEVCQNHSGYLTKTDSGFGDKNVQLVDATRNGECLKNKSSGIGVTSNYNFYLQKKIKNSCNIPSTSNFVQQRRSTNVVFSKRTYPVSSESDSVVSTSSESTRRKKHKGEARCILCGASCGKDSKVRRQNCERWFYRQPSKARSLVAVEKKRRQTWENLLVTKGRYVYENDSDSLANSQFIVVTPEMILECLDYRSHWRMYSHVDDFAVYFKKRYPVNPDDRELRKELSDKLRVATVIGLLEESLDRKDQLQWRLATRGQEAAMSQELVLAFWDAYLRQDFELRRNPRSQKELLSPGANVKPFRGSHAD